MKKHLMWRIFIILLVCAVWGCTTTGTGTKKKPGPVMPQAPVQWVEPPFTAQWIKDKILEDGRGQAPLKPGASLNQKAKTLEQEGRIRDALWICGRAAAKSDPATVRPGPGGSFE